MTVQNRKNGSFVADAPQPAEAQEASSRGPTPKQRSAKQSTDKFTLAKASTALFQGLVLLTGGAAGAAATLAPIAPNSGKLCKMNLGYFDRPDGYSALRITNCDSRGLPVSRDFVPTTYKGRGPADAPIIYGGFLREMNATLGTGAHAQEVSIRGDSPEHPGIGWEVSHYTYPNGTFDSTSTLYADGTRRTTVQPIGEHIAKVIFEAHILIQGCPAYVRIEWLIVSGRDHAEYSITVNVKQPNCVQADSRAPYGVMSWAGGGKVKNGEWRNTHVLRTMCEEVMSANCPWDYTELNAGGVTSAKLVSDTGFEAGLVARLTQAQGGSGVTPSVDRRGTKSLTGPMATPSDAPWQMNVYEEANDPENQKIAAGENIGAVGGTTYQGYMESTATRGGRPFSSGSTLIFGQAEDSPIDTQAQADHQRSGPFDRGPRRTDCRVVWPSRPRAHGHDAPRTCRLQCDGGSSRIQSATQCRC